MASGIPQTCSPAWFCLAWDHNPSAALKQFHPNWLAAAIAVHAAMSLGFGIIYGLLLPRFGRFRATGLGRSALTLALDGHQP